MALLKSNSLRLTVIFLIFLCLRKENEAKLQLNETTDTVVEVKTPRKQVNDGAAMLFADELKQTLERYLFGICPSSYKTLGRAKSNITAPTCDLDTEQQDLAGRLATLALRVHSAARADCSRLGAALANTLGELARTAANRHATAANEANKKRKLSKSQKAKQQAKQRTALAVKKKAAALAAAAAAKVATS